MIIRNRSFRLMLATLIVGVATTAVAADYEPPVFEAPIDEGEYVPVEVGSGWYLRGDVSYNFSRDHKKSRNFADDFVIDDSFFGAPGWVGPFDIFGIDERANPVSGSIGFGYHFNDFIRADLNVGILNNEKYSAHGALWSGRGNSIFSDWSSPSNPQPTYGCLGSRTTATTTRTTTQGAPETTTDPATGITTTTTPAPVTTETNSGSNDAFWRRDCDVAAQLSNKMYDGTASAYVDLGTFAGLTPYVGAGAGLLYSRSRVYGSANCTDQTIETATNNGAELPNTVVTSTTTTTFRCADSENHVFVDKDEATYNLMYSLSAGFAYQLSKNTALDVGYTYKSAPNVEFWSVSGNDVVRSKGFDSHAVKVGLRYDLW